MMCKTTVGGLMTRKEMLHRLENGEDPLDLSIEKWERVEKSDIFPSGLYIGSYTCALCTQYDSTGIHCDGCPVFLETGGKRCCNTPHEKIVDAYVGKDMESFKKYSNEMVKLLKSLKEEGDGE